MTASRLDNLSPRKGALLALAVAALILLLSQQLPATYVQELSAPILPNVSGLDKPETGSNGPFRWNTGPVQIELQPLGYPLYASLDAQGVRPAGEPEPLMIVASGGKELHAFAVPPSPYTAEVKLPTSSLAAINPTLDITTTMFQPPGDRRTLGIVFYRLTQQSGPGPALPSLWPALMLLLSALLLYRAAFLVWRRTRYALFAAGGWSVLIGLLNAFERPWLAGSSVYWLVPPLAFILAFPWLRSLITAPTRDTVKESRIEPVITEQPWPIAIVITTAAALLMLWHLVAASVPEGTAPTDNLAWGVSFYGKLPWPVQALGVLVVMAAVLWALLRPVQQASTGVDVPEIQPESAEEERGQHLLPGRWIAGLALGAVAICAALPVRFSEGDSSEFDRKIPVGAIWRERELLDFYLKAKLWQIFRAWLPLPSQIYVIVADIAGGIYTAGALLLGRTLGRTRSEAWIIAGAMLAIGNVLLFFGYVESYALVNVASLFVLWASYQYTEGRVAFGTVGALATLAALFHGSALWWGPMVVAAFLIRAYRLPRKGRWRRALPDLWQGVGVGLAMMLVMASVAITDGYDFDRLQAGLGELGGLDGRTLMPLFTPVSPYEHYVYFSWPHLGAVIQEQLLTAPLALLTIIALLLLAWPGLKRLAGSRPSLITLAVGAASMLYYTTAWNPDLGSRSDWDLLSLGAPALTLLAIYLLTRLPLGKARNLAIASYLSISGVHAAAWVLVHLLF